VQFHLISRGAFLYAGGAGLTRRYRASARGGVFFTPLPILSLPTVSHTGGKCCSRIPAALALVINLFSADLNITWASTCVAQATGVRACQCPLHPQVPLRHLPALRVRWRHKGILFRKTWQRGSALPPALSSLLERDGLRDGFHATF